MTKLPPPPSVGSGSTPTDDATSEAARAAAQAELPDSVTDLPDAWLLDVEPPPPPAPLRAEVEADDAAPPSTTAPLSATTSPPPTTVPPTSGFAPDRRTIVAVAAILSTALVAVFIARCNTAEFGARAEPIASATARDGGNPLADDQADAPDGRAGIAGGGDAGRADGAAEAGTADRSAAARAGASAGEPPTEPTEAAPAADAPAADAPAADTTAAAPDEDAPTVDDAPTIDGEPTVDDAADAAVPASADPKAARPSSRTDSAAGSGSSAPADPPMTPEESLAKARAAWKAGNAKDTYKYANKSRFKQPSDEATELATLAACKMKLDDSAKASYRQLDGERKKRTRIACRDFGVRVGL